jgi:hypothetical protein
MGSTYSAETGNKGAKFCPLSQRRAGDPYEVIFCKEGRCAWWDRNSMECSVYAISISLNNINETLQWAARLNH